MQMLKPTARLAATTLAATIALLGATSGHAATQGSIGSTSTGTVVINASILARVNISNLSDLTFADSDLGPSLATGASAQKTENVCVWSNNADRSYFLTASGVGDSNGFALKAASTPNIPFSVA